jgi:hypothetical protein
MTPRSGKNLDCCDPASLEVICISPIYCALGNNDRGTDLLDIHAEDYNLCSLILLEDTLLSSIGGVDVGRCGAWEVLFEPLSGLE